MKLNIIEPPRPGDRRTVTEQDLDRLLEEGCYDSYGRVYFIQDMTWVVVNKIQRSNGITEYILECEG
jgi:hypothetical protein